MLERNERYNNFIVTKNIYIDEIKVRLIELEHIKLGTNVIKILNDDDENLFCMSFKTLPKDSTGVSHILEHTVLCGSKKFPVKDPFFSMLKRSLNTFMNAMTGSDFTCYPAASMVEKDFYNLFEVYLDAVFNPKLDRISFLQEGHRFEFSSPKDASTNLVYKGVVYNEMKGSMSNPDNILINKMFENLTPDLPYAYNSGGDPQKIPELTYEELKDFHKNYYHPSECLFFFYGNLDLKKQLDFIEEKILKNSKKKSGSISLPKQKRFSKPKIIEDFYPIAENESSENKSMIAFGYLTCSIKNQIDLFALSLLDIILMGTDASYLKLALMQSDLCKQADSFLETEMSEAAYLIICKGCSSQNKEALLKVIKNTLLKIIEQKIPKKIIEAALHQLEFSRTEISHDIGPYGLVLFFRSALNKQHGIEPENALVIHSLFNTLRKNLEDENYLPNLIQKYFLNNSHLVELTLKPSKDFIAQQIHEEEKKLSEIQNRMTPSEIEKILKESAELKLWQKKLEETSLSCLPKIDLEDVPKKIKKYPLKTETITHDKIFHHDVFTNEILYADLLFDLPLLNFDELTFLPLFTSILTEVGSGSRNYIENLNDIQAYTGGITSYLTLNVQADNFNDFTPSIAVRSKALYKNSKNMFSLLKDTVSSPVFNDTNRIRELILEQHTFLENMVVKNSMKYASALSQSSFSYPAYISSLWYGIAYLKRLQEIVKNLDKNLPKVIDKLDDLKTKLFKSNAHLVISSCTNKYLEIKKENFYDLLNSESKNFKPYKPDFKIEKTISGANFIPSPVAFSACSYKTVGYLDEDAPYLLLAGYIFENIILHKKIREEGGAYGSAARFFVLNGIFTFSSYRDPNVKKTFDVFKLAIKEIVKGNFTEENLYEAKLGVIQNADTPLSPGARALTAYTWLRSKQTEDIRQKFRDKVLEADKQHIIEAVKKHLLNQIESGISISFCSKELFEKENQNMQDLF